MCSSDLHFPYRIIEKKYYENIHDAPINQLVTLKIEVIKHYPSKFRRQPYRVNCLANETLIDIVYFNARHPVIRSILPVKSIKMISGKLEFFKNKFQITHPSSIENISDIQLLKLIKRLGKKKKKLFSAYTSFLKNLKFLQYHNLFWKKFL